MRKSLSSSVENHVFSAAVFGNDCMIFDVFYRASLSFYFVLLAFTALQSGCGLFAPSHHPIEDYKPVFAAASAGNIEAVRRAVATDPSVLTAREWDDATLLHLAVGQNHKELAEFLLDKGADVNALTTDHLTPLHMAAQNGNLDIVYPSGEPQVGDAHRGNRGSLAG
jgi:hypothetical protein